MSQAKTADPVFPRVGEIHLHDTNVAICEDWKDDPGDDWATKNTRSEEHLRGIEAAFRKLVEHLKGRGFRLGPDKIFRTSGVIGSRGGLEFAARFGGRQAQVEFYQTVTPPENPNGARHDFGKFKRMPRDLRLRCVAEIVRLIRVMQGLGYTFGPQSDLSEPLARAVVRKAEGREQEGLSPIERYNRDRSPRERITAWPSPEELDAKRQPYDRKDKDGRLLCNGDLRYWYDHGRRLVRGRVYNTSGNAWSLYGAGDTLLGTPSCHELFSTDRPDLLPRRLQRETQVSRVAQELQKARALRDRWLGDTRRRCVVSLPDSLGWLAPVLWCVGVVTSQDRVLVLEKVVERLAPKARWYYVLSRKERDRGDASLTFWRSNASGYVWSLGCAGRYQESEIKANQSYYDNEDSTIAVPCEAVEALAGANGCVANTPKNLHALLRAAGKARKARGQPSLKADRKAKKKAHAVATAKEAA